ncbi:MAG: DUF4013 domain-containing protein [Methanomicrobiales archaeon]|nr:DUF4013 domain-containing protein [Methanomicrobiales archaeon]
MIDIATLLNDSVEYTRATLTRRWIRWLILALYYPLNLGYYVAIMRGEKPDAGQLTDDEKLFKDGLSLFLIFAIYLFPVILIFIVFPGGSAIELIYSVLISGNSAETLSAFIRTIVNFFVGYGISLLTIILLMPVAAMGAVRFARTHRFVEAFNFTAILLRIDRVGWVSYSIALIIPILMIAALEMVLTLIPIIGWLFSFPVFFIFLSRYITLIYESVPD